MSDRPEYVGLLNRLSLGESAAHVYLSAWADTTPNPDLRAVLRTVAAREGEHGMAMAKRINELGYELEQQEDTKMEQRLATVRSDMSDADKFEAIGLAKYFSGDGPDIFDSIFHDHSIDIKTAELLGRYIAEERDSTRQFENCYRLLREAEGAPAAASDRLAALDSKVDALCEVVLELREMMSAPTATAGANGKTEKARAKA